ncbi:MAG: CidA/LrgA family protein [Rhizobiaceae bacterium]|nr:CidA/LrgA family protein [Rhizobiaceae bacterium]
MLVPAFAIILLFQLTGEVIARAIHLPLPGPVLGMVFMAVALNISPGLREIISPVAKGLLRYLALMFVPVGVGVVANLQVLQAHWFALTVSILVSTALAILVGAATFVLVARLTGSRSDD